MDMLKKMFVVFILFTNIVLIFVAIAIAAEALNIEPLHLIGGLILCGAAWELLDIVVPWMWHKWKWNRLKKSRKNGVKRNGGD